MGTADRYADLSLLLANAQETWVSPQEAQAVQNQLFEIHSLAPPDLKRLEFYLRLDPLTWG